MVEVWIDWKGLKQVGTLHRTAGRGRERVRYSVIPAWQVHDFLDWDRPFAQNAVPTIQSSEKNSKQFNRTGAGGVVEGRTTFRGLMRALKRKLYRFTLGKTFLQNTSGIHVFSRFEQEKITTLIALREPNFLHINLNCL